MIVFGISKSVLIEYIGTAREMGWDGDQRKWEKTKKLHNIIIFINKIHINIVLLKKIIIIFIIVNFSKIFF